jgi:hypothetical protein
MKDKFFVVSGNRKQFDEFILRKAGELWMSGYTHISLSNFIHVSNADKLMGQRNCHGWFVGTWYDLPDLQDILKVLIVRTDGSTSHFVKINELAREIRESRNEVL